MLRNIHAVRNQNLGIASTLNPEPEVELEEPEEEPAAVEPFWPWPLPLPGERGSLEWVAMSYAFGDWKCLAASPRCGRSTRGMPGKRLWRRQSPERKAREEENEKRRLPHVKELRKIDELYRLREQQQRAACANGCLCVCEYGGSRKRDFSAMDSPLASRSVSTFNAKV